MKTFLYVKRTDGISEPACHTYEHWLIGSFFTHAADTLGIDPGVLGYCSGTTFENVIFVEAWFYTNEAAELFATFMADERLDHADIPMHIAQCECESRQSWDVDRPKLDAELTALQGLPWHTIDALDPFEYDDTAGDAKSVTITRAAKDFKSIGMYVALPDASLEDRMVFARYATLLDNMLDRYFRRKGWYTLEGVGVGEETGKPIHFGTGFCLHKDGVSNQAITDEAERYLRDFDVSTNWPFIHAFFTESARHPDWIGRPVDNLTYVDFVAGLKAVGAAATKERISAIHQRLRVRVRSVTFAEASDLPAIY